MVLLLMLVGYAFVYLTTPQGLAWHLDASVHRLLMQLWPTGLLAFFLAVGPCPGLRQIRLAQPDVCWQCRDYRE